MTMNSAWFFELSGQLSTLKGRFSEQELLVGTMVSGATTEVGNIAPLWRGPIPNRINTGASYYSQEVADAAGPIAAAIGLIDSLSTFANELAGNLQTQERVLANLPMGRAAGESRTEEIHQARNVANQAIGDLRLSWLTRTYQMASQWESTITALTSVMNAVAFGPPLAPVDIPSESEYVEIVASFCETAGLTFNQIDPSGQMQKRADELHEQLDDPGNNFGAGVTSMVIDVAYENDYDKSDGNWSWDDIVAGSENGASVYFILTQINREQDMGWTDEQISTMTDEITANAWLLRTDQQGDWEDHDNDETFGDWFKAHVVGPAAGFGAFMGCMAIAGPETGFIATGACVMAGGATARSVGTWANGGGFADGLQAAVDPQGMAIDLALVGGLGLFQAGRYVYYARQVEGAPSLWALNWSERGYAIEAMVGGNLPHGFRTIDILDDGFVASVKSLDLTAATYQNTNALTRQVTGYIDNMATYSGGARGGIAIRPADITGRGLMLAVPEAATAAQQAALEAAVDYGASRGVQVVIVVIP